MWGRFYAGDGHLGKYDSFLCRSYMVQNVTVLQSRGWKKGQLPTKYYYEDTLRHRK
jgi:hypothetical protein